MIAALHRPSAPLDAYVDCFWHFPAYPVKHQRERALPTGTMELVVNLGEQPMRLFADDDDRAGQSFSDAVLCGPHSRYFVLDTSNSSPVAGIHFRPGGATPFLGVPADELRDCRVALGDLWGSLAREARERLSGAKSPAELFGVLEDVLRSRLRGSRLLHPAVAHAVRRFTTCPQMSRIAEVQGETGYGAKRFIELFSREVGLTPKAYSRILRFQAVINRVARGGHVDWAAVAVDGGYCDQSHLVREFRLFSGTTPALYEPVTPDRPSHLAA